MINALIVLTSGDLKESTAPPPATTLKSFYYLEPPLNSQIGQSTSNTNRRKLTLSCVLNQIHYLDCPLYVLIPENVKIELASSNLNPIVIGQVYKSMSFFSSVFIYLTLKSSTICMCLSYV